VIIILTQKDVAALSKRYDEHNINQRTIARINEEHVGVIIQLTENIELMQLSDDISLEFADRIFDVSHRASEMMKRIVTTDDDSINLSIDECREFEAELKSLINEINALAKEIYVKAEKLLNEYQS
jgi:hypothetical protein